MITMKVRGAINPRIRSLDQLFELPAEAAKAAVVEADKVFRAQEKALFESEGASGGQKWVPLSKAYERRKAAIFASAQLQTVATMRSRGKKVTRRGIAAALGTEFKILQFTGDMRRAFSTAGRGHIARTSKTARGWIAMFGAEGAAYYALHARGGKVPNRPPIRNPLLATEAQWDQRLSAMQKALTPFVMRSYRAMTAWRGLRSNL
jgi:hypothetical protein